MKIPNFDATLIAAATSGDLAAIDALLSGTQPGVFNLAVRMLGNREDASDATQEILLKVVTHLGSFRGEAAFSTWVYQIARNHLLSAATRSRESPEVSLEALQERLQAGLDFGTAHGGDAVLTPEDKAAARQVALGCTQSMLMTLDRDERLTYLLDAVFGLSSDEAAQVLDIAPAAYRKRLSRVRAQLEPFFRSTCGLANPDAACRCERQLPAIRHVRAQSDAPAKPSLVAAPRELAAAEAHFAALTRMSDSAAVFRAHPQYHAPNAMIEAIRAVLRSEGFWGKTMQ